MDPRTLRIEDFDYPLTDERIAKFPVSDRSSSRLLTYCDGTIDETIFCNLPNVLPTLLPGVKALVFNNTKVIHARLVFRKPEGARIEIFCLEPMVPAEYQQNFAAVGTVEWKCMVGSSRKWKSGSLLLPLEIGGKSVVLQAERLSIDGADSHIRFVWKGDFSWSQIIEAAGELPIPPYLGRATQQSDLETYQTVYSKVQGSVAAPTAGLHFTPEILETLRQQSVETLELTLHVGAGTFHPVKTELVGEHGMHAEWVSVSRGMVERLRDNLGHVVAVGTTSVRTLESLCFVGARMMSTPECETFFVEQWEPYDKEQTCSAAEALDAVLDYMTSRHLSHLDFYTRILIAPPYRFKIVNALITNFHQPHSTLLLLVAALIGDDWKNVYRYALDHGFRFLSYGDSSLLIPRSLD